MKKMAIIGLGFCFAMLLCANQIFADVLMCGNGENWEQKGDKLIRYKYKLTETREYPAPPGGLSVSAAADIINGKETSSLISSESSAHLTRTLFFPMSKNIKKTTRAYFQNGKWSTETVTVPMGEEFDSFVFSICYALLFLLIVLVGIFSQVRRIELKKLLQFYAVALSTMIVTALFTGGMLFGSLLLLAIAMAIMAVRAAKFEEGGVFVSIIIAAIIALSAYATKNDNLESGYLVTVGLMCVVSLILALLTRKIVASIVARKAAKVKT